MSSSKNIILGGVVGAVLIAGALAGTWAVGSNLLDRAMEGQRYQLSSPQANYVYRLDRKTGEVAACSVRVQSGSGGDSCYNLAEPNPFLISTEAVPPGFQKMDEPAKTQTDADISGKRPASAAPKQQQPAKK